MESGERYQHLFHTFRRHTRLWIVVLVIIAAFLGAGGGSKIAHIVSNSCVGCTDCTKVCPVKVITMVNGKAVINTKKCIGCQQCVFVCSYSAIRMEVK